jgi:hypothetical protein
MRDLTLSINFRPISDLTFSIQWNKSGILDRFRTKNGLVKITSCNLQNDMYRERERFYPKKFCHKKSTSIQFIYDMYQ